MWGKSQEDLYRETSATFRAAPDRPARAYEADPENRRDLIQEIHLALWRSFEGFDGRCSLRTWVYRVAHNAAAIAEITALSPSNVATKIHRIKNVLARRFHEGGSHAE
jgi:hypothetical protein